MARSWTDSNCQGYICPNFSISGISQLLLPWFWQNFKSRFLGPSLTDANCHGDLCTGKICPGDIYPNQEYLGCSLPNFDQTFWPLIFWTTIFWTRQISWPKCFRSTTLTTRTTTQTKTKDHQSTWVVTSKQLNLVTDFFHICAVRLLTTRIEISHQQIILIIFMVVFWQV